MSLDSVDFSIRGISKVFVVLFRSAPCVPLQAPVGPRQWSLLNLRVYAGWVVLYLPRRSSGVSPGAHKQIYGVVFLSSSLLKISLVLTSAWGLLPLVLQPESRGFIPLGLLPSSLAHIHDQARGRLRENPMGFSPS